MSGELLETLIRQTELLTSDEKLALASRLIERARQATRARSNMHRRKWAEVRGLVAHPLTGEDAQAWVSRTRQESDEARGRHRSSGA
jgi:hypothetical protein